MDDKDKDAVADAASRLGWAVVVALCLLAVWLAGRRG